MALNTDYTDSAYNSYITVDESDLIWDKYKNLYPTIDWIALSFDQKESWLLNTANELNVEWAYEGNLVSQVTSTESGGMQWPRRFADHANGLPVAETEVPNGIKEFQVVRALEFLANPSLTPTGQNQTGSGAIKKQKLDVLEQEFFEPSSAAGTKQNRSELLSYKLIEPYLHPTSVISGTVFVVRA